MGTPVNNKAYLTVIGHSITLDEILEANYVGNLLEEFTRAAPDTKIRHLFHASVDQIPMVESMVWSNYSLLSFRCFYTSHTLSTCLFVYSSIRHSQ